MDQPLLPLPVRGTAFRRHWVSGCCPNYILRCLLRAGQVIEEACLLQRMSLFWHEADLATVGMKVRCRGQSRSGYVLESTALIY